MEDYPCSVEFVLWFLKKRDVRLTVQCFVLFADEESFTCEGMFKTHNMHMQARDNPHGTRPDIAQHCFVLDMQMGIVAGCLVCPYILPPQMNAHKYFIFLEDAFPKLLINVPTQIRY